MAYSDKVIDHYENPRNVGSFDKADDAVGTGMVGAPACGDVMKLQIKVGPDGRIEDARFKTYGCGSAIASSSLVTEWVKGKTLDQATTIKNTQIAQELSLPPVIRRADDITADLPANRLAELVGDLACDAVGDCARHVAGDDLTGRQPRAALAAGAEDDADNRTEVSEDAFGRRLRGLAGSRRIRSFHRRILDPLLQQPCVDRPAEAARQLRRR